MVVERFGGAGPKDVADGAGGEAAEVAFDENFSGGGEDEQGLDHGVAGWRLVVVVVV